MACWEGKLVKSNWVNHIFPRIIYKPVFIINL